MENTNEIASSAGSKQRWPIERREHGLCGTKLYQAAYKAWSRCYNPKDPLYYRYGGRGIVVDPKFDHPCELAQALLDAYGEVPDGFSIDRRDNDGNYVIENIRYADRRTQNLNRSTTVFVEYAGMKKSLAEWSRITGIPAAVLSLRYKRGWSPERMLTTPVRAIKQHPNRLSMRNLVFEFRGERRCLAEWCALWGRKYNRVWVRLFRLLWPFDKAIQTP
jgi:hypothetical protein